ncbi:MAG: ABC transporter ATP-binding protein [Methanomassiliicoccales archaeon]|nr:ABC transporter ATP-binding protein [Methanomassiliicoccales archaeon]
MSCEDELVVRVDNLSFSYGAKRNLCPKTLKSININAHKGQLIGIMGPNGCGKTTFMRCINKVLKPQEGAVYIDGKDIDKLKMMEIAKICANIPADVPDDFHLSVEEFVALGRYPYITGIWWEGEKDERLVREAMAAYQVTHLRDRKLGELSSGEKARVLLAKGAVQQPKILLADEPSAHLDLKFKLQVMQALKDLSRQGVTVITASHDINLVTKYCDLVIVISAGQILSYGPPAEIINEEIIRQVYDVEVTIIREGGEVYVIPLRPVDPERSKDEGPRPCEKGIIAD